MAVSAEACYFHRAMPICLARYRAANNDNANKRAVYFRS